MKRTLIVALALAFLGVTTVGCKKKGGDKKADDNKATTSADKKDDKKDDKADKKDDKKDDKTASASGDKIGVPACDEYLNKYEKCVTSKVPEAARSAMQKSMQTIRSTWKKAAETDVGKKGLEMGCQKALEMAKKTMAAYKCEW